MSLAIPCSVLVWCHKCWQMCACMCAHTHTHTDKKSNKMCTHARTHTHTHTHTQEKQSLVIFHTGTPVKVRASYHRLPWGMKPCPPFLIQIQAEIDGMAPHNILQDPQGRRNSGVCHELEKSSLLSFGVRCVIPVNFLPRDRIEFWQLLYWNAKKSACLHTLSSYHKKSEVSL